MKKALFAVILCLGLATFTVVRSNAQEAQPSYDLASSACASGRSLSHTIVKQRDAGVDMQEMLDVVATTPDEVGDNPKWSNLAKNMAQQAINDAYANPKYDANVIAARSYARCMKYFGYPDSAL